MSAGWQGATFPPRRLELVELRHGVTGETTGRWRPTIEGAPNPDTYPADKRSIALGPICVTREAAEAEGRRYLGRLSVGSRDLLSDLGGEWA